MKFLITILAVLVIQIVDAVEEKGDVNIVIGQHVVMPDVDECLENIDACADNEVCVNLPGTYRCACVDGFEKVKGICKDVDECLENIDACPDNNTECVNSFGSYSCICSDGFEKLEDICEDIDECIENCVTHGECINSPGSFSCTCNEGFEEVEGNCEDIDECQDSSNNPCSEGEKCTNNISNYTCSCYDKFTRVKGICEGCTPPSAFHEELGCITPVIKSDLDWFLSRTYCQEEGKSLIEGIKKVHLDYLVTHFGTVVSGYSWIGMQNAHWITSNEEVPLDDEIWAGNDPPGEFTQCGVIDLGNHPSLANKYCIQVYNVFCQSLP